MATVTFSNLGTPSYDDTTPAWAQLFSAATIQSGGKLSDITITGLPSGLNVAFDASGTQTITEGKNANEVTFTVTGSGGGVVTITQTGGTATPSDADWQNALRALRVDATSQYSVTNANDPITVSGTASVNVIPGSTTFDVSCFYAGTLIRTPDGERAVETLKHGDLVLTHDGREVPVCWLGRQTISTVFADKLRVLPIRIKAGALGENTPARDLLVSPDHAMFIEGVLVHAGALVNDTSIIREANVPKVFTYYHVEVEDHSLIFAEGAPAETFVDNVDRLGFDNWAEYEALYPNGKTVEELPYPRAKARRQVPVAVRVALAARAEAIGAVAEAGAAVA